jgi:hypothetical protein
VLLAMFGCGSPTRREPLEQEVVSHRCVKATLICLVRTEIQVVDVDGLKTLSEVDCD